MLRAVFDAVEFTGAHEAVESVTVVLKRPIRVRAALIAVCLIIRVCATFGASGLARRARALQRLGRCATPGARWRRVGCASRAPREVRYRRYMFYTTPGHTSSSL
jgi:hypothetical protein